jgi:hypothetical protein
MTDRSAACAALALLVSVSATGCTTRAGGTASAASVVRESGAIEKLSCAPGSALLRFTRLCQDQAAALILTESEPDNAAPDGCAWVVNEARVLGNGALLYRALRCNGRTAQLEFVRSARGASFDLAGSPFGPERWSHTVAVMFNVGTRDPKAVILEEARRLIDDPAESARCQVRRLDGDVAAPGDALVVDEVPIQPAEDIRSACGEYGYDGGAQSFWRVSQDFAWFFTLGNDTAPVDAASFTLIRRDEMGRWVRS